jgi:DNA-binding winged helix-turn-helix (wHTH) protein/Tol biopolymer transport system component
VAFRKPTGASDPEPHEEGRPRGQYCFADFTLDLEGGFLRRGVQEVTLRPKAFEVLSYLVKHHGRLVSKTALTEAVWPDAAITDNSLAQCLLEIRRALADDSQQLIRTVARRGYVFTAPVSTPLLEFPQQPVVAVSEHRSRLSRKNIGVAAVALLVGVAAVLVLMRLNSPMRRELNYTQITNFTDSAVAPALSPDGRMVAFFRSDNWFLTRDQIFVKMLPNGEPVQITHDPRQKYGLAFSPDGSRIAYATSQPGEWKTNIVSPLGGDTTELLSNAAGLTWLDPRHVLFSEISTGQHMGMVTATENRSEYRKIYFPKDERGMVHLSYASPDRKWALAVEMNPVWQPCRLVPLDGNSEGRQVGPRGKCTSAAWSPDGKWMYFGVEVEGNHHLWRQRFPAGEPEQITSGPTEEDGVAVLPDSRSLITSIGSRQSAVWIHDNQGERELSSEGFVTFPETSGLFGTMPVFSRDAGSLFYLNSESEGAAAELWRTDLKSGKSEAVLRGMSILEYDISTDGKEVVFSTQPIGKPSQIWLASLNRSSPPRLASSSGEDSPHFGRAGEILYRLSEGKTHYLARMNRDGSNRLRVVPYAIGNVEYISPDRKWITTISPAPEGGAATDGGTLAVPTDGGAPRWICRGCGLATAWAPDGKFLYVSLRRESRGSPAKTVAIPIPQGQTLPNLPPSGIQGLDLETAFPRAHVIEAWNISPGPEPSVFAYVKTTTHRNLFRIPLRDQ